MEEMSTAVAGPLRLSDVMCTDAIVSKHINIAGLELIPDHVNQLSSPKITLDEPYKSISCGLKGSGYAIPPNQSIADEEYVGENGIISPGMIEIEQVWISGESTDQRIEANGCESPPGDLDNSCSQSVASDISSLCDEELLTFEANAETKS